MRLQSSEVRVRRGRKIRIVEWRNSFCTIRFKTYQPAGETLNLRFLCRYRKPITRSKRTIRGKVSDERHNTMQHGESWNETKALQILVNTAHPDIIHVQPFELRYKFDGKLRRYTPDVLLIWGDEFWVVEIKEDKRADLPEVPYLHFNAIHIMRYQRCPVSTFDRERLRCQFEKKPQVLLGSLNDDDIRFVLYLVIEGTLHLDWWSRLSRASLISTTPIGHQEWPNSRIQTGAADCPEMV
jgi:hypothetical protein